VLALGALCAFLKAPNPNFVGSLLDQGLGFGLLPLMYDPNYRTPRSVQMNAVFPEMGVRPRDRVTSMVSFSC
jgi:hypothetical protein